MRHLSIDTETFSSVDIAKSGLYKYVESADFQILLFAYSFDFGPVQVVDLAQGEQLPPEIIYALQDSNVIKHAYNAAFEWYCLNKFFYSPLEQWRCTMIHNLYCGYTAGLAATAVALGLPGDKRKMSVGSALIQTFCVPTKPTKNNGYRTRTLPHHEPEKWQLFKEYCRQDVVTEMEIEKRLSAFPVPEKEQRLWELDQLINAYGVAVDLDLVSGALHVDEVITTELMNEAIQLSGLDNPKSVKQLTKWLTEEIGEEVDNLQKSTVSKLINLIDNDKAKRVLEIRQELAKTSVKKYQAMRETVCADGRIRGLLQFYGANRSGRWAGRLVQVQNLPRNHMETLGLARELVKNRKIDALKLIYGNVHDTLSQLIRTAFIPSPGHVLIVSDFSAIEARVIAWLAGEQWRLDVFNTHGKIYEASATQMFGVPIEKISKGNPEYELRQKGKIAELALGYQGGVGALIAMGALDMGLTEEELPDIVRRWRSANKRIVDLWYSLENAAIEVMRTGQPVGVKGLVIAREGDYNTGQDFLTITLPSGRKLFYVKPFIERNERGREALHYWGVNQESKKWEPVSTYGGKLVENCLAGDTKVLTLRGWVKLQNVRKDDLLWDGIKWVGHGGLINKGMQQTITLDGVRVTPDHLILTERGWVNASSCEGYYRDEVALPNRNYLCGVKRQKVTVDYPLRLWKRIHNACDRIFKRATEILRLSTTHKNCRIPKNSRDVKAPCLLGMALNERPLHLAHASCLGKLWGPWYQSLSKMAGQLRSLLGRHGSNLQEGSVVRPNRCERRLLPGKLSLGINKNTEPEQAQQYIYKHPLGAFDSIRGLRKIRDRRNNIALQTDKQLPRKPFVCGPGRYEQVYDLINAGSKHRFTVLGDNGPFIVHNCVQAIARDCLSESLIRLNAAGYRTVMHVHDEVVLEVPEEAADLARVTDIMGQPIPWAPGLPLKAAGFITKYYMKD